MNAANKHTYFIVEGQRVTVCPRSLLLKKQIKIMVDFFLAFSGLLATP